MNAQTSNGRTPDRRRQTARGRTVGRARAALLALLALSAAGIAGSTVPPRNFEAPEITLDSLDGVRTSTSEFADRALVIVFGELTNDNTRATCDLVLGVLDEHPFSRREVVPILVVAQDRPVANLKEDAAQGRFPDLILHDPDREAFGAYRVLVIPSVVVLDRQRRVVYASPGFVPRFHEFLSESVLVATGRESAAHFERKLGPVEPDEQNEARVRADRLVSLGDQLLEHGLEEMAEARFHEAVTLLPGHARARLALGQLLIRQGRLDEAEAQIRELLTIDPESVVAEIALAEVMIRRGEDEVATAEQTLLDVVERKPKLARAHYLLGLIHEGRGDCGRASAAFKRTAELLFKP